MHILFMSVEMSQFLSRNLIPICWEMCGVSLCHWILNAMPGVNIELVGGPLELCRWPLVERSLCLMPSSVSSHIHRKTEALSDNGGAGRGHNVGLRGHMHRDQGRERDHDIMPLDTYCSNNHRISKEVCVSSTGIISLCCGINACYCYLQLLPADPC